MVLFSNVKYVFRIAKLALKKFRIKVSGYDLLGQWKVVRNYGYINIIGQSINNILQQYFLLSLFCYLRKF